MANQEDPSTEEWERFELRHTSSALRTAISLVGRDAADDVIQDAFLKAYRSWGTCTCEEARGAWFLRIVTNTALDYLRKSAREQGGVLWDDLPERLDERNLLREVEECVEVESQFADVQTLLRSLPKGQLGLLRLLVTWEMSPQEAAQHLGTTTGAVRTKVGRILQSAWRYYESERKVKP